MMPSDDPLWFKDAVIYEVHVRAFCDSRGDGMGDFRGLTQKLDYLQDLGVTAIWLLPFYPSPQKDDGYDIADYTDIHSDFGSLESFQELLEAAHARGLRVITELVMNHTSDQHPWFQRARRAAPGSPERDFYVWTQSPDLYREARIIFKDFETSNWTYDNVAKAYYWHRFYSHQPDLNFDNPRVWEALMPVVDFWFGMGVDGLRLDAIPYLYEREGTNCENLVETHEFLKALRRHVDARFPNRMLLAEANQWPEDSVAYFGNGDECHMAFHFPVMPRLFMSIHMEDRFPIVDIMQQTPAIPEACQWALFLRNHDELTLEMVTDEERDYMYRAYANDPHARINLGIRRRLAPLLGNNRRRMELMNGLLFSLPGTPVIYYGDEIGMGDNIYLGDRNGVRTPMQWSADRNAGFSRANPQKLYLPLNIDPEYHYEAVNVDAQQSNPHSLLWWMKRLISQRRQYPAFSRGSIRFLHPANRRVLVFLREYGDQKVLVVANLSRFVQYVEIDLSEFAGATPVELFGQTPFPVVTNQPYLISLGPHSFYWFQLNPDIARLSAGQPVADSALTEVSVPTTWERMMSGVSTKPLEAALLNYLRKEHSLGAAPLRSQHVPRAVRVRESFPIRHGDSTSYLALLDVEFRDGPTETMLLPLALVAPEAAEELRLRSPEAVVARLHGGSEGWLCDATFLPDFNASLLKLFVNEREIAGDRGSELAAECRRDLLPSPQDLASIKPERLRGELNNASIAYGTSLTLKLFRNVDLGPHPESELGQHLTQKLSFPNAAKWVGEFTSRRRRYPSICLGVVHQFVPNEGHAWQLTLDELSVFFERVTTLPAERALPVDQLRRWPGDPGPVPAVVAECIGGFLETVRHIARRLAELHLALAADREQPEFAPEEFNPQYQRSTYQSMRKLIADTMYQLMLARNSLSAECQLFCDTLARQHKVLERRFQWLPTKPLESQRIRCHGDCHLGQLLFNGKDFIFIDFEGSPLQSLGERRIKRSPLRDVASMLRSFDYVALSALRGLINGRGRPVGMVRTEDAPLVTAWTDLWSRLVQQTFLTTYLEHTREASFSPPTRDEFDRLMDTFLVERMLIETEYELTYRPTWLVLPLQRLVELLMENPSPNP